MTTNDLVETLEGLRIAKYPSVSKELVQQIVAEQAGFMEAPAEAYKRISKAIESALPSEGSA